MLQTILASEDKTILQNIPVFFAADFCTAINPPEHSSYFMPQTATAATWALTFGFADHHVAVLALAALVVALHLDVVGCFWLQVIYQVPLFCT